MSGVILLRLSKAFVEVVDELAQFQFEALKSFSR